LSQVINHISFEYLPSAIDIALGCLDYLDGLGRYEFNIVEGEVPEFSSPEWTSANRVAERMRGMPADQRAGEIYARLVSNA